MKFIVANWKMNLDFEEAVLWSKEFSELLKASPIRNLKVVICPPYLFLPLLKDTLPSLGVGLGSQDVSLFGKGPYTGEVSCENIKHYADFSIVGHSERRRYFNESDKSVYLKVGLCRKNNIQPIVCVSKLEELALFKDLENIIVAYEPLNAIGSGKTDSLKDIVSFAKKILSVFPTYKILYGGSVSPENAADIMSISEISGVLVGTASVHVSDFFKICQVCDSL